MSLKFKKLLLVTLMILCLGIIGLSQSCLPEGIQLTKQSQIDSFPIYYPNCTEIEGSVTIQGTDIINLQGLNAITSIGRSLRIEGCDNLSSFSGLNNLISISGHFRIISNYGLINLVGLENLTTVSGDFWFYASSLRTFTGLTRLKTIGNTLTISANSKLKNVDGIEDLDFIGGNLVIMSNDSLMSLQGFDGLKKIDGSLIINYNDKLKKLSGLDNVDSIGGNLSISVNDSLSICAVDGICRFIANPNGFLDIQDNAPGCNSREEIKEICDTMSAPNNHSIVQWVVYPNPASNKFTISNVTGTGVTNLNIYNQLGQRVLSIIQVNGPIDISILRKGLYLVEFTVNGISIWERIVKF